jgi:hypothetical protein
VLKVTASSEGDVGIEVQATTVVSQDGRHNHPMNPVSDVAGMVPTKKIKFGFLLKTMNVEEIPEPNQRTSSDELVEYASTLSVTPSAIAASASIDPIHFWLHNGEKYPALNQLALDIISAPASEAYAERVFSLCGLLTVGRSNRTSTNLHRRAFFRLNSAL